MTILKHKGDIRRIRGAGQVIKEIFSLLEERVVAGVSTAELDRAIEEFIKASDGTPAFKGYRGYPATICASVNNVVVHGIPSENTVLAEGDIIGIDVGVKKGGYYADAARTYTVGGISGEAGRLVEVARKCLAEGVKQAVSGNNVGDIANAIQTVAEEAGYQEVRTFVGHGIGKNLHEEPEVPNWGEKGKGPELKKGLVLAIEPMINEGTREVKILEDDWTAVTVDGKLSAHFEDTIIVGDDVAETIT